MQCGDTAAYFQYLNDTPQCCGRTTNWTGSANGTQWVDTPTKLDAIRVSDGCVAEVALVPGRGRETWTFTGSTRLCSRAATCDGVRSIRLFRLQPAPLRALPEYCGSGTISVQKTLNILIESARLCVDDKVQPMATELARYITPHSAKNLIHAIGETTCGPDCVNATEAAEAGWPRRSVCALGQKAYYRKCKMDKCVTDMELASGLAVQLATSDADSVRSWLYSVADECGGATLAAAGALTKQGPGHNGTIPPAGTTDAILLYAMLQSTLSPVAESCVQDCALANTDERLGPDPYVSFKACQPGQAEWGVSCNNLTKHQGQACSKAVNFAARKVVASMDPSTAYPGGLFVDVSVPGSALGAIVYDAMNNLADIGSACKQTSAITPLVPFLSHDQKCRIFASTVFAKFKSCPKDCDHEGGADDDDAPFLNTPGTLPACKDDEDERGRACSGGVEQQACLEAVMSVTDNDLQIIKTACADATTYTKWLYRREEVVSRLAMIQNKCCLTTQSIRTGLENMLTNSTGSTLRVPGEKPDTLCLTQQCASTEMLCALNKECGTVFIRDVRPTDVKTAAAKDAIFALYSCAANAACFASSCPFGRVGPHARSSTTAALPTRTSSSTSTSTSTSTSGILQNNSMTIALPFRLAAILPNEIDAVMEVLLNLVGTCCQVDKQDVVGITLKTLKRPGPNSYAVVTFDSRLSADDVAEAVALYNKWVKKKPPSITVTISGVRGTYSIRDSIATPSAQFDRGLSTTLTQRSKARQTKSHFGTLVILVGVLAGLVVLVVGVMVVNRRVLAKLAEDISEHDSTVEMALLTIDNPAYDADAADSEHTRTQAQPAGRHDARPPTLDHDRSQPWAYGHDARPRTLEAVPHLPRTLEAVPHLPHLPHLPENSGHQAVQADQLFIINGDVLERRGGEDSLSPVSGILWSLAMYKRVLISLISLSLK